MPAATAFSAAVSAVSSVMKLIFSKFVLNLQSIISEKPMLSEISDLLYVMHCTPLK